MSKLELSKQQSERMWKNIEDNLDRIRHTEEVLSLLYEWIMDENREPANTKFTAGTMRNIAKEFEFRINDKNESKI